MVIIRGMMITSAVSQQMTLFGQIFTVINRTEGENSMEFTSGWNPTACRVETTCRDHLPTTPLTINY
jgi:hypothetical protein